VFIDNSKVLGRDLRFVSAIALSHNHYDHTRGLLRFHEEFHQPYRLYLSSHFFKTCMWDGGLEFGESFIPTTGPLDAAKLSSMGVDYRMIYKDVFPVREFDGASLLTGIERSVDFEQPDKTNFVYEGGEFKVDLYRDEQVLCVETQHGTVILTGCAHTGIANICECVKRRLPSSPIAAVIGGTHLIACDEARIEKTAHYLSESGIAFIGVCHCTGEAGFERLAKDNITRVGCGFSAEF
ncbi:MAG: MBL fold metallo-hydrolase, partial [Oscillospiraceae bacterium]